MMSYLMLILGSALICLVVGGMLLVQINTPDALAYLWTPADKACQRADGSFNEACIVYYPSIITNAKLVIIMTSCAGVGLIIAGLWFRKREAELYARLGGKQ